MRCPIFVGLHNLEMVAVSPKNCYRHYVSVPQFWRNWEAPCIMCVPSSSMFAYYFNIFGDSTKRFDYQLLETAMI